MCRIIIFSSFLFLFVVVVYCCFIVFQTCPFFHLRSDEEEEMKTQKSRTSNYILLWQSVCAREIEYTQQYTPKCVLCFQIYPPKIPSFVPFAFRFSSFHITCHYSCVFLLLYGRFGKWRGARSHIHK